MSFGASTPTIRITNRSTDQITLMGTRHLNQLACVPTLLLKCTSQLTNIDLKLNEIT